MHIYKNILPFFKEGQRIDINGSTKWDSYNVLSYGIGQLTDLNKKELYI